MVLKMIKKHPVKNENKVWVQNGLPKGHALNGTSNKWHVCLEMYTWEVST